MLFYFLEFNHQQIEVVTRSHAHGKNLAQTHKVCGSANIYVSTRLCGSVGHRKKYPDSTQAFAFRDFQNLEYWAIPRLYVQ